MLIDLQLHSTNSDGYLTPAQLCEFMAKRGVKVASLTDHNTVSGQEEFFRAARKFGIKAIAGLELYVKVRHHHYNILWYNFDVENPALHYLLRDTQNRRRATVRRALEKLLRRGYHLEIEKLLDAHNHYIPINHVVDHFYERNRARVQQDLGKHHVLETEIIRRYFRNSDLVALHESYFDFSRVARIKREVGGQIMLAHPCKFWWVSEKQIAELKHLGLDGLELLSPHHSWEGVSYLQAIADQHKLIVSGGTDFHRFEEASWCRVKSSLDYYTIDSKLLKGVEKIIS